MIIIFGPAGSGKSVQGQLLAKNNNWKWLSAGQLLRESHDSELLDIINTGELAPADKVNEIMAEAFKQSADMDRIILDGFPRQVEQAKWLIENSPFHGHCVGAIIVLDVDKSELIKRLVLRGRPDDTPEAIEERLDIYHEKINPVISYFESQGVAVLHIDGIGTVEQIHDRIMEKLAECKIVKK
ncbi:MAG: nucleoside monophosphate kinase [Candidatus Saccharibacteria bacterium]